MDIEITKFISPEQATGFGLAVPLLWWIWRELRKARSEDKRDSAEEKLRDDLMKMNTELVARADRFAQERNDERERRIKAEAEVHRLRQHIEEVAKRCESGNRCGLHVERVLGG